jgi:hypothetical protein
MKSMSISGSEYARKKGKTSTENLPLRENNTS